MRQRILAGVIVCLTAATTHAALLTYEYSGYVTSTADPALIMPVALQIGDPFTFTVTWDNSVADLDPDPTHWNGFGALRNVTVSVPGYSVSISTFDTSDFAGPYSNVVSYYNDYLIGSGLFDGFYVSGFKPSGEPPADEATLFVTFAMLSGGDPTASAGPWDVGNADPSLGFPIPADFPWVIGVDGPSELRFTYLQTRSHRWDVVGTATAGHIVPIPAVGWLLGPVLGVLGWVKRKSAEASGAP